MDNKKSVMIPAQTSEPFKIIKLEEWYLPNIAREQLLSR
jgi:hypothetical protein